LFIPKGKKPEPVITFFILCPRGCTMRMGVLTATRQHSARCHIKSSDSSLPPESGDDNSLLLKLLDNVIVLVAFATLAVGEPVNVKSRCVILARNGPVNFPVAGEKITFDNRPHNFCAKKVTNN
jgi:hypothetical protein